MQKTIELEKRALLTESDYNKLREKLQSSTVFLGEDNKYVEYWIYSDKLLKLVKNHSKNNSILSLKLNPIGTTDTYEEYELKFSKDEFDVLAKIVSSLTKPDQIIKGSQKRENYTLEGVEVSIKWSEDWQFHVELEVLIEHESQKVHALEKINKIATLLNVKLMTIAEEKDFIDTIRSAKNQSVMTPAH